MDQGTPGSLPPGEIEEPPPPDGELKPVKWDKRVQNTSEFNHHGFIEKEETFVYRTIRADEPDSIHVCIPMYTTDLKQKQRPAYAETIYVNYKHQRNVTFIASENQTDLLTKLRK